jgi:6-phosphogluconolactonase
MAESSNGAVFVFVGTFTRTVPHGRGQAEGIAVLRLDPATGGLTPVQTVPDVANPSFLALHPRRPLLYAVNAVPEQDGRPGGSVSAFAVDPATGGLTFLNRQPSHGAGPCHVSVDRSGRWAFVANFGGGSIAALPIREDGSLGPATDTVQHVGSSVHPERQRGPHAHSINLDPDNRYALVADLGLDRVMIYRLDLERGALPPNDPPWTATAPGAGPRHVDFHPNGRHVFVINEIDSTLTAYDYDAARGTLGEIQTVSTLPEGFAGANSTADVHVHPSGRFVYGSNRGHDSLVIFAVDPATGRMSYVGHEPTHGRTPRNFAIDPTGAFLFAANQDSDTIVTFRVDQTTGVLTPTGQVTAVLTPVCIKSRWAPF